MKKVFLGVFLGLLISGILFCGCQLFAISKGYEESRQIYSNMNEQYVEQPQSQGYAFQMAEQETPSDKEEIMVPFEVDFDNLMLVNSDIIGWIYIPNTVVNYPIVKSKDNVDYLNRAADGSYAVAGAIFVDCNNQSDFSDQNTIIYGHNMKDGSMFHCLSSYGKQDFYAVHDEVWIMVDGCSRKYRIVAAYQTTFDSNAYFTNYPGKTFSIYAEQCIQQSLISPITPFDAGKPIITLSTCMKHGTPKRFVVILQLVEEIYETTE